MLGLIMAILLPSGVKQNIKLARYTTYKIGGPAKYFCAAKSEDEIAEAVSWARKEGVPYFILGGGSNILVSGRGFDGLVVKIQNTTYNISPYGGSPAGRQHTVRSHRRRQGAAKT